MDRFDQIVGFMEPINHAISVVTPIYNVKTFVRKCVESLMNQTFKDVEYIFVDDASSDGSIDILNEIVARYPELDIKILHHQKNRGLPASRETGITAATGDYIFNCDGDDFVETTMLEKMYRAVSSIDADYAYCDFFLTFENGERYMHCPEFKTPDEALRIGYLGGTAKYNVWNKLIRRTLYEGTVFPVDHRKGGEDMIMFGVLSKAKSLVYVPEALYHYVKTNPSAISESFSQQRLIDIQYNANQAISVLEKNYPYDLTKEIALFKLNVKLPFIISNDNSKYAIWKEWYPEANQYIFANKNLPFRTKFVQWMAAKNQWWYVRLYNLAFRLFYKVIYG